MQEFAKMIYLQWRRENEERDVYFKKGEEFNAQLEDILSVKILNDIYDLYCDSCIEIEESAFIAGFAWNMLYKLCPQYSAFFPVLFIGFLGAFTTFSSFALESVRLLDSAEYGKFFLNIALQNIGGIGSAAGGFLLAKIIFR